jgi:hypothetical protein
MSGTEAERSGAADAAEATEAAERWGQALDEFEARLGSYRTVIEPTGTPPEGMWPPASLVGVPLPEELAGRARSLLDRARMVEGELQARRTELPPPQRPGVRHRRRPTSSTISTAL